MAELNTELGGTGWQSSATGTASLTFNVPAASVTWTVQHNLGFRPNVQCFDGQDGQGQEVIGRVEHDAVDPLYLLTVKWGRAGCPGPNASCVPEPGRRSRA